MFCDQMLPATFVYAPREDASLSGGRDSFCLSFATNEALSGELMTFFYEQLLFR